ncbi:hybrid sensor histidine kinase/response regulator [Candidatus Protochlamydia phocaeensis]|uniref:hybrid sensor histidine kinase/response regulator n=1 Tax=Candidatus Protochlamydia phocaeensis TaxID=1414722 RepID=UPI000838AC01|nr:response regulator [Candidatus Protochlamydia phocaeensis]
MDKSEEEFLAKLLKTYKIESQDLIKQLTDHLLALESHPGREDSALIDAIFREAHSLKGSSRAVDFYQIEKVCQSMEDVLGAWKQGEIKATSSLFDTLHTTVDWISQAIQEANSVEKAEDPKKIETLIHQLKQHIEKPAPPSPAPSEDQVFVPIKETPIQIPEETAHPSSLSPLQEEWKPISDSTIRVSSLKLTLLLRQVEEILSVKFISDQHILSLQALKQNLDIWEKEWRLNQENIKGLSNAQAQSWKAKELLFKDLEGGFECFFKEMNRQLDQSLKQMEQDHFTVSALVDRLLDETKQILMQPFSTMLAPFPKMVREIARSLKKEAILECTGKDIEIDKRILEELKEPFIHLIRNSLDHGIEQPEERIKKGKSSSGTIRIDISSISSQQVEIVLADDGGGIDLEKVKQSALKQGSLTQKEAQRLDEQQVINLIFQSGLSTSPRISELSGRGIGMSIIIEKIERLGGQLSIETAKDKGTAFRMVFPLTLATFRGLHIQAGKQDFILPTQYVAKVLPFASQKRNFIEGHSLFAFEDQNIPYASLARILGLDNASSIDQALPFILIIQSAHMLAAIGVEDVLNEKEILIRDLGKQLLHVQHIAASTIDESGQVILILDPFELTKSILKDAHSPLSSPHSATILVADDSPTMCELLKRELESAGYRVVLAKDGREAIEKLNSQFIDLLISDIEMPVLNGFELVKHIRNAPLFKYLPIILCTSLTNQTDYDYGLAIGANAYFFKKDLKRNALLDTIKKLLEIQ